MTAVDMTKEQAPAELAAPVLVRGDLVELEDGALALVASADPVTVVRLGQPAAYELPARKVL